MSNRAEYRCETCGSTDRVSYHGMDSTLLCWEHMLEANRREDAIADASSNRAAKRWNTYDDGGSSLNCCPVDNPCSRHAIPNSVESPAAEPGDTSTLEASSRERPVAAVPAAAAPGHHTRNRPDDNALVWKDGYREGWNAAMTQGAPPWTVENPYA